MSINFVTRASLDNAIPHKEAIRFEARVPWGPADGLLGNAIQQSDPGRLFRDAPSHFAALEVLQHNAPQHTSRAVVKLTGNVSGHKGEANQDVQQIIDSEIGDSYARQIGAGPADLFREGDMAGAWMARAEKVIDGIDMVSNIAAFSAGSAPGVLLVGMTKKAAKQWLKNAVHEGQQNFLAWLHPTLARSQKGDVGRLIRKKNPSSVDVDRMVDTVTTDVIDTRALVRHAKFLLDEKRTRWGHIYKNMTESTSTERKEQLRLQLRALAKEMRNTRRTLRTYETVLDLSAQQLEQLKSKFPEAVKRIAPSL